MTLIGSKGGGGGTFKQRPDTLRSNDTFEALMGVGAGPMKGPTRGLKSVTINGTPVEDETGKLNFENFLVIFADGDPAKFPQIADLRLGAGAAPVGINVSLTNTSGGSTPGPWVTRTIPNVNADFIDLRFVVSQLYRQDKKGIYEAEANLHVEMKPSGSTNWINPMLANPSQQYSEQGFVDDVYRLYVPAANYDPSGYWAPETNNGYFKIFGKTNSPAVHELRITVPNQGAYANKSWDIRVRLIERDTLDADPDFEKRTISWESASAGYNTKYGSHEDWRGLAWLQIYGKATDQINSTPEVAVVCDTLIVPVPPASVFNPDTRQYTGALWDGSWTQAFTTDPAWVINGLIVDSLHGMSSVAVGSTLNKWDALEASKWCSQLVPDGAGGMHPRYSMNLSINETIDAREFVQYLAGAVGGIAWEDTGGEWRIRMDKPENPVDIFTLETIEGDFSYSNTDVDTRFNDITIVFKNEEFDYREDRVRVVSNPHIAKFGRKPTTIVAVGCTNRQEALRRGMLRLRAATREVRSVTFRTNRRGRLLERLDTILVADTELNVLLDTEFNTRSTGRIVAVAPDRSWIEVRDPLRLELGVAYSINFTKPNPDYNPNATSEPTSPDYDKPTLVQTIGLVNNSSQRGDVVRLYLASPLPADVAENANLSLVANGLPALPKAYRVLDIEEDGEFFTISAIELDTGKWAAADNVTEDDTVFIAPDAIVPPPTNLVSYISVFDGERTARQAINLNWDRPASRFLAGFKVDYAVNGGPWIPFAERTAINSLELVDPVPGNYQFRVYSVDRRGALSEPAYNNRNVDEIDPGALVGLDKIDVEDGLIWGGAEPLDMGRLDNRLQEWDEVNGDGKPEDNATVGGRVGSNIKRPDGAIANPGELLNSEIDLEAAGRLTYRPLPDAPPVELGRITPQGLGVVTEAAFRRAEDDIDQLGRALATALDEASSTRATFRDAGFYVDAATSQIRIHAIEQTNERVSTAEIRLNAAEANINLRATNSFVLEQIALAVIDPSQIAELTDIFLRLGAAELDIDGLNATVTTLATVTELSLVQGRITTAEEAIDALEGTITTKVDTTTFDALATRVTNAETTLTAIGDTASIINAVSATRLIEKAQDDNAEADLRSLLLGDKVNREQVAAAAAARQELTARIVDGDAAEAAFRLALEVRVGATEAAVATESIARASADSALATQITQLTASTTTSINSLTTSIANETSARTTAINAEADARIAAINAEAAARGTAITAEETARIAAINAERAQTLEDVAAEAAARAAAVSTLNAAITSEQTARTDADTALATSITNLSASLTSNVTTLQTNINNANQARIDGDGALAASISALNAELDTEVSNRAAAVESETQARVAADGLIAAGLAQQVTAGRVVEGQASELADLLLGALLNNDKNRREVNGAVAGARQEITAQIVSEVEALSTRILALVARVAGNEASIIQESLARVTAVESLATSITSLNASFTGALSAEATARTNAIAAEATTRAAAISAETAARTDSVNTLTNGLSNALGRLDDEELARLQGDQAEATARAAALTAEANARIAAINAEAAARGTALTAEENARIAAINAEIAAREAAVTTLTASISNEAIARANADGALAGQISTLNTTVAGQSATLTTFGESINGLRARWGAKVDINGRVTGFVLNGDADETDATFVVDNFKVVDPDTGAAFLDADADGLRLQNGKVIMNNGTNMLVMGAGFGVDNQFVMWFGPSRGISACNEADALFFLDVTGDGEYGLRLGSNFYKNSGTGTSTAADASVTVGPFVTDGGSKQVNLSFRYLRTAQISSAFAYTGTPQAVVRLERRVGTGSFEMVQDFTFNGTVSGTDPVGSEPGLAIVQINQAGSFTDTTSGTADFTYRARIISRSVSGLTSTVTAEQSLTQEVELIITEQIT